MSVSLPEPPLSISLPAPPWILSLKFVPTKKLLPLLPIIVSAVKPKLALTFKFVVPVVTAVAAVPVPMTILSTPVSPAYNVKVSPEVPEVKRISSAVPPLSVISAAACSDVLLII